MFVIPDEFLTVDDTKAGPPLLTKEALDEYLDNEEEIILKSLEEEGRPVKFKRDTKQPRNTDIMKRQVNIMQPRAPWGLSAISKGPRSIERGLYCYDRSAGFGTFIYILDSGADIEHADLRGRAYFGYDATSDDVAFIKQERQIQEHGTHVASIAAGKSFGVAKKATIIDVKVMREPSEESYNPSLWTVSNGIEWAIQDILAKNRLGKAVLNLSFSRKDGGIGTRTCMLWVESVMKALDVGIHVVIAAGNQDISAEMRCPGNTPRAITVGATDMQDRRWVRKGKGIPGHKGYQPPGGSNWGRLVDIFAPGHRVLGAYAHTDGFVPMTGTSMATPHVSGVIAYLLALEGPLKPSDMAKRLRKLSEKGIVNDPRDSPNYSLYNGARG